MMTAFEMATQSLMTEDEAKMLLAQISNMALWKPEMIIELSRCGFDAFQIARYLDENPMWLLGYLAIQASDNLPPSA